MAQGSLNNPGSEEKRLAARDFLMKARTYRYFALAFMAAGLFIFMYIYFSKLGGEFSRIVADPAAITVIVIPFLPAAVLSWLSRRFDRKFQESLKEWQDSQQSGRK